MAKRPSNRLVRKAIREIMEPQIAALGFTGKYPEFRRDVKGETHFLLFQTNKYGGSFWYSVAWRKRLPYLEHGRDPLPPDQVTLAHTDFDKRATAAHVVPVGDVETQRMAWRSVGDFEYDQIVEDVEACRALVKEAAEILPRLDHWLKTREPGLGVVCKGHLMRGAGSPQLSFHMASGMVGGFDLSAKRPETPYLTAQNEAQAAPEYWID